MSRLALPLLVLLIVLTLLPAGASTPLAPAPALAAPALQAADAGAFALDWISNETGYFQGLAWADADADGDLDLAVGNDCNNLGADCSPLQLYRNDAGALRLWPDWSLPYNRADPVYGGTLAWGDMNGDGYPDLAVGGHSHLVGQPASSQRLRVYRNEYGTADELRLVEAWASDRAYSINSLAWGDIDGDGQFDLVANADSSTVIYRNQSTQGQTSFGAPWAIPVPGASGPLALADADGDLDLDLAVVNAPGSPSSRIYRNESTPGALRLSSPLTLTLDQRIFDLAWGDLDGDTRPDLVFGTYQGLRVSRNTGGPGGLAFASLPVTPDEQLLHKSIDLGDIDSDGDLDVAAQMLCNQPCSQITVYASQGPLTGAPTRLALRRVWSSPLLADNTQQVALGDMDGDGALDLAASNFLDQPARVFRNLSVALGTTSALSPSLIGNTTAVAWGDLDGDGDPDVAVGRKGAPPQVWRNRSSPDLPLALEAAWTGPGTGTTTTLAWGDVDSDGDLDLAVGYDGQGTPIQIFFNNGAGTLAASPAQTLSGGNTQDLAWGDVDGDGDLDLAAGSFTGQNGVYRNEGGRLSPSAIWTSSGDRSTTSVAWGDVDGDGDLDLAVGNYWGRNQVYRNEGGTLGPGAIWTSTENDNTTGVAWADVDGDGDLDLAVANDGQANRLHLNNGGNLSAGATWSSIESERTQDLSWGDVDGDGDLDLAVASLGAPARLYRNDSGALSSGGAWASEASLSLEDLAWADVDRDGDLDLATAGFRLDNSSEPLRVFRNGLVGGARLFNQPPSVTLAIGAGGTPARLATGELLATGQVLTQPTIAVAYTLRDPEGDRVREVRAEYSLDGGGSWRTAEAIAGTPTTDLEASPAGTEHTFLWDTVGSGVFGQSDAVRFRLVAFPALTPARNGTPDTFQRAFGVTMSDLFRVRGTLPRVIDQTGAPVAGALVFRLPATQARGGAPLRNRLSGAPLTSTAAGYIASREPLAPGDWLIALRESAGTPKYTLYRTSGIDRASGLPGYQVEEPGTQTLTVSDDYPLIAFKLSISLEWDGRNDTAFMAQLRRDLARTAELLYDWTDGQATIGAITLYHNREHWEQSDVQIFATNRMRPNATQGGITTETVTETVTVGGQTQTVVYEPGQVRLPATWSRNAVPGEVFGEDWPRSLAHELGHYALYLDDNYLGLDDQGNLIIVPACPGAMSDPYSDLNSEFQLDSEDDPSWRPGGVCAQTLSARGTGRSDWATIRTFYPQLQAPASFNEHPGPERLALDLLTITQVAPAAPPAAREVSLSLVVVDDEIARPYAPSAVARAVLYQGDGARATDLGAPTGDVLLARGARSGDTVCVYDTLRSLAGCLALTDASARLELRDPGWRPLVLITPVTSTTLRLEVPASGVSAPGPERLEARIFPETGAPLTVSLAPQGASYVVTQTLSAPAMGGLVRLWDPAAPLVREAVADYSLGGNPAPPRKPRKRKKPAPALSSDGQAILFTDNLSFGAGQFYAFQTIDQLPAAPTWAVPVSLGYRLLASDPQLRSVIPTATALSLSYFSSDVPPGAEDGVQMYFYPEGGGGWQALPTMLSVEEHTAGARPLGEGIYALMASVPLRLEAGWNLIFPYPGDTQRLPDALIGAAGHYRMVYGYDEDDADDPWKLNAPGLPAPWAGLAQLSDLDGLANGQSYWVWGTRPVTVPVRPDLSEMAATASAGGILGAPPATYYGLAPAGAATLTVEAYVGDRAEPCGATTTEEVMLDGAALQGFGLNVLANGGGAALGCGSPGAPVRLVFRDGEIEVGSVTTSWDNTRLIPVNLTQSSLNQIFLPFTALPEVLRPDLQVVGVTVAPAPPGSGERYELRVTVRNAGPGAVTTPFWVDLYVDPEERPAPGQGWPDAADFGASWRVYGLAAGQTVTLSSLAPNDPRDPGRNYTALPALLRGRTYTLYAQADVFEPGGDPDGVVGEVDEENNIAGPYNVTPGGEGAP